MKKPVPERREDTAREMDRLRQLNAFKTDFINSAAHELSTPLTPIRLQLNMLKAGMRGNVTDAQRWSIDIIDRNVERLHSLVRDLLDVARLEAQKFPVDMRPTDLASVLQEAAESYREPAEHAGLAFETDLEPGIVVLADRRRLVQVLFNLIGNAIKFTPAKGKILITSHRGGADAVVTVTDTGVGFDPKDQERLFQAFSQIFNPEVGFAAGAGLGLYISRSIVDLHGGRIWAASRGRGRGATFAFTLPLAAQGEKAAPVVRAAKVPPGVDKEFAQRIRQLV